MAAPLSPLSSAAACASENQFFFPFYIVLRDARDVFFHSIGSPKKVFFSFIPSPFSNTDNLLLL